MMCHTTQDIYKDYHGSDTEDWSKSVWIRRWSQEVVTYFVCSQTSHNGENRKEKTKKDKMATCYNVKSLTE